MEAYFTNAFFKEASPRILDTYTAYGGYSFHKIKNDATKSVQLRLVPGGNFTDVLLEYDGAITMNSTVSTGGTLLDWVGSNSAAVSIWYDQTGNGNDLIQPSTGLQGYLVESGVLNTDSNGNPAIKFNKDGTILKGMSVSDTYTTTDANFFMVSDMFTPNTQNVMFVDGNDANDYFLASSQGDGNLPDSNSGTPLYYVDGTQLTSPGRGDINDALADGDIHQTTVMNVDLSSWTAISLGQYFSSAWSIDHDIPEIIIFDTDQDANRIAIEADQNLRHNLPN